MSQKVSKRQERREKMQRQQQRQRLITIGLITLGAALVVFCSGLPPAETCRRNYRGNSGGAAGCRWIEPGRPNATATIDVFEDFQCPACQRFTENTEPLVIQNLVATGKARYVFHNYPFLDGNGVGSSGESDQAATPPCARTSRTSSGRCTALSMPTGMVKTRAHSAVAASRQWQRASGWIWMPSTAVSVPINTRRRSRQISTWVANGGERYTHRFRQRQTWVRQILLLPIRRSPRR